MIKLLFISEGDRKWYLLELHFWLATQEVLSNSYFLFILIIFISFINSYSIDLYTDFNTFHRRHWFIDIFNMWIAISNTFLFIFSFLNQIVIILSNIINCWVHLEIFITCSMFISIFYQFQFFVTTNLMFFTYCNKVSSNSFVAFVSLNRMI